MSYRSLLRDPRWQRRRLEILQRDHWQCQACGARDKELHVHHRWYGPQDEPWKVPDNALLTLCRSCHRGGHMTRSLPFSDEATIREFKTPAGTLRLLFRQDVHKWYLDKLEIATPFAHKMNQSQSAIWERWMARTDGEMAHDNYVAKYGFDVVEWQDQHGTSWVLCEYGLEFLRAFNPDLAELINAYYRRNRLGIIADNEHQDAPANNHRPSPVPGNAESRTLALAQMITEINQEMQEQHQANAAEHHEIKQHLAAVDSKLTGLKNGSRQTLKDYLIVNGYYHRFSKYNKRWIYDLAVHLVGVHRLHGVEVHNQSIVHEPYPTVHLYMISLMDESVPRWIRDCLGQGYLS